MLILQKDYVYLFSEGGRGCLVGFILVFSQNDDLDEENRLSSSLLFFRKMHISCLVN